MKKTVKMMLAMIAGATAFVSCKKEAMPEPTPTPVQGEQILSFTAGVEGGTKTTIDYSDNIYKVNWCKNDQILVMDGTNNGQYAITSGEGTGVGILEFTGTGSPVTTGTPSYAIYPYYEVESKVVTDEDLLAFDEGQGYILEEAQYEQQSCDYYIAEGADPEEVYAYYRQMWETYLPGTKGEMVMAYIMRVPYTKGPQISGDKISNINIPDKQVVAQGQCVDPSIMLMAAKSTDSQTLNFKNLCSYIKVTLTEPCLKVTITSRGGEFIAGNYTADFSDAANPLIKCDSGVATVTLTAVDGLLQPGTYYMAIGVSAMENGLSVKYYRPEDGCFKANIRTNAINVVRNNVYDAGSNTAATVFGAQWSIYMNSVYEDFDENLKDNATKMVISTNVPVSAKPADAKLLGEGTSVWVYMDEQKVVHIETPADKIWAKEIAFDLGNYRVLTGYTGLENFDVTEIHNANCIFYRCNSLEDLDISSWRFVKITSAESMFDCCWKMTSLKLNDTFDISDVQNLEDLVKAVSRDSGAKCVISGITKESIKEAFKDTDHRDTGWNDSKMMFE